MKAYDLGVVSDRFRNIVIDCRVGPKGYSIFEGKETRADTLELIQCATEAFSRSINKLKICCV